MKFIAFCLIYLLLCTSLFAKDLIVSVGGGVISNSESKETSTATNSTVAPTFRSYGGAFANAQIQYNGLPLFDWVAQGQYTFCQGLVFYDYVDGNNHGTNERQKTSIAELTLTAGPRLNFLSFNNLKFFAGAGGIIGSKVLIFDKTNYLEVNKGSSTGFEESDTAGQAGHYYELGLEYRGAPYGFRLMAQHQELRTGKFKTLDNTRLTTKQQLYSFNFTQQL